MSVRDFMVAISNMGIFLLIYFSFLPIAGFIFSFLHKKNYESSKFMKISLSVILFLSCIPGIFSGLVTLYLAIFQKADISRLNVLVYFLPPFSMLVTMILIRKNVRFESIPGFKKIMGVFIFSIAAFIILLILDRLRIYLFFHGSIWLFALLWIVIFLLLKYGTRLIFGKFRN